MTQVSIHNNVDIKAYVDVLHSPKSLDDEALKVSLYKPSATVVEHEIATFGRDAKGQFFTLNLAGAEIDELGSWDLVVRANEGTIFQTEKTLEAFDVVLTGGNTDTVVLSVLLGQKPCGCACQGSDPAEDTPSCPGKGCTLTVDTSWPETLSDDHVPSSKLVHQTLDTHTVPFTVERLGSYLYKASYQAYPQYDPAYDTIVPAGCSSFVRDGKLYRNFDWTYTDSPEFLVVASGFTGMALLPGVHDADTLNAQTVGQAPYHLVDGANDAGIRVSTHVVTNDFGISYIGGSYPSTRFVHDVLTHVDTLEDLAEFVGNLPLPSFPAALVNEGYVTQWFITDGTSTFLYAPDAQTRSYVLTDISARPQLTNFKWVDADTLERNDAALQSHPTGVERWNEISDGASLQDLAFTKAYTTQDRLSEFIGLRGTDKNSTDSELEAIQVDAAAIYARGQRDGLTWQTMHSIVYAGNHIESLYTQEDYTRNYTAQGGANIELKTINGQSLIGSGNIEIQGSVQIDTSWPSTLSNSKVPSTRLVKNSLNAKLDAAEALTTYTSLTDFTAGMATKLDATEAASTYATKQELPVIPTNVGAFTNDAGYLTEHQSLKTINNMSIIGTGNIEIQGGEGGGIADAPDSGNYVRTHGGWVSADLRYATQTALVDYETSSHAASTYATKSEIPAVPTRVSDLTNDTGFITSSALSDYETSAHASSTYATQSSLSVYETSSHAAGTYATQAALAAKADADDIPTKTSDLTNDSGFLTSHQSLADYATTASVTSGLAGKQDTLVAGTGISIAADGKTISSTQELFFVEFGVTTQTAVRAAVSAGKLVVCDYNNRRYYFTIDNGSQIYYATTPSGTVGRIYTITQNSDTNWSSGNLVPQLTSDRISSTGTTTPSDEKYFSALRVKNELDAKQDTLIAGTGISIAADGKTISATGGGSDPDLEKIVYDTAETVNATAQATIELSTPGGYGADCESLYSLTPTSASDAVRTTGLIFIKGLKSIEFRVDSRKILFSDGTTHQNAGAVFFDADKQPIPSLTQVSDGKEGSEWRQQAFTFTIDFENNPEYFAAGACYVAITTTLRNSYPSYLKVNGKYDHSSFIGLNNIEFDVLSENKFSKFNCTNGYIVNNNSGGLDTNAYGISSDFIPVPPESISGGQLGIALINLPPTPIRLFGCIYDANKTKIDAFDLKAVYDSATGGSYYTISYVEYNTGVRPAFIRFSVYGSYDTPLADSALDSLMVLFGLHSEWTRGALIPVGSVPAYTPYSDRIVSMGGRHVDALNDAPSDGKTYSRKDGAWVKTDDSLKLDGSDATANPLANILRCQGYGSIIHHWGIIGDSLASGEFVGTGAPVSGGNIDCYEYSWGHRFAKLNDADAYCFSNGGCSTASWLVGGTDHRGTDYLGGQQGGGWAVAKEAGMKKQAYVVALGVNDYLDADDPEVGPYSGWGSASTDYRAYDPEHDTSYGPETFCSFYMQIINRLKYVSPGAKIFLMTPPKYGRWAYTIVAEKIREVYNYYVSTDKFTGDIYLLDMNAYLDTNISDGAYDLSGHGSSIGYQYFAWCVNTYIDWVIRNNATNFRRTGFEAGFPAEYDTSAEQ